MIRYELTGSGISDGQDATVLMQAAKDCGAIRPRRAYHHGWNNQPYTVRFSAESWQSADIVADAIRSIIYPINKEGRLCPMIRAYPVQS